MPDCHFLKDAGHDPASPAVFDGEAGEWLTRGDLVRRINEFAGRLEFPTKALIFVFASNDLESLIAYLAALRAGHTVAMLNAELDETLRARLISIFQPDFIAAPRAGRLLLERCSTSQAIAIHPDLSLLISTSGSTGSPKLVRLSWRNLESNARQIIQALRHTERDRTMVTAPIFNGYGQSVIHTMLLAGGSREWEHQVAAASRPGVQEPALSTPEVPAYGGQQDRIRGLQESSLKSNRPNVFNDPAELCVNFSGVHRR
jgi:acyl-CoA synthetase (AMP-forming)/AMP-acid ligase II